jgi:hypothetical protein
LDTQVITEKDSAVEAAATSLIRLDHIHKTYQMGDVEIHALRGINVEDRARRFSSPSWARQVQANQRR